MASCWLLLSCVLLINAAVCRGGDDPTTIDVTIANGTVTGSAESVDGRAVWRFLGIPFAEPPVGSLRYLPPQPIREKWSSPLVATSPANGCMQIDMDMLQWPKHLRPNFSEDCLYLNVWTPDTKPAHKKTVMVWIHGGGFAGGEALPLYDGKALAAIGDVVVVVIQYRLGLLGFARLDNNLVPGNMGLLDQQQAFRWVHENIAQFGGDPDSVTIFGESAGSGSVSLHLLNEESSRYFRRGIMQSGTATSYWACNPNTAALEKLNRETAANYLNCSQEATEDLLRCIQGKSEEEIRGAVVKYATEHMSGPYFGPTVDGNFLTAEPDKLVAAHKISRKDVIIGVTDREGSMFVLFMEMGWRAAMNLTGGTDDDLNATFVHSVLDQLMPYFPAYPTTLSPLALKVLKIRALSHSSINQGFNNAKRLSELIGQWLIYCGVNTFADSMRAIHDNIFFYVLSNKPSTPLFPHPPTEWEGTSHGEDIPLTFAFPLVHPHLANSMTEDEKFLSRRLITDFSTFAKTGRPRDPNWRPYTEQKKDFYHYSLVPKMEQGGIHREECAFWDHEMPLLNAVSCKLDANSKCTLSTSTQAPAEGGRSRKDEL